MLVGTLLIRCLYSDPNVIFENARRDGYRCTKTQLQILSNAIRYSAVLPLILRHTLFYECLTAYARFLEPRHLNSSRDCRDLYLQLIHEGFHDTVDAPLVHQRHCYFLLPLPSIPDCELIRKILSVRFQKVIAFKYNQAFGKHYRSMQVVQQNCDFEWKRVF